MLVSARKDRARAMLTKEINAYEKQSEIGSVIL